MIRKCIHAVLSLALILSAFSFSLASSAGAAELIDTPLQSGIYNRPGVSGVIRYSVPFGAEHERATPYVGLSLDATKAFSENIGPNNKYSVTRSLAEVRFTNSGVRSARIGGITMLDDGNASGDVLSGGTILWVLLVAAVAAGAYLIIDGGGNNNSTSTATN